MDELLRFDTAPGRTDWGLSRLLRWSLRPDVQRSILEAAAVPLTPAQAYTLAQVVECGPIRLSELAERLGIDSSTLTARVHQLVHLGFVRRDADPRDRRAAQLAVTPAGRDALAALHRARRALIAGALDGLSDDQQQAIADAITRLADQVAGSGGPPAAGSA